MIPTLTCWIFRGIVLLLLILSSALVGKGLYLVKDGFSPRRIYCGLGRECAAEKTWGEEEKRALKQTYRYIGRGRQCFAFASEDGRYVLKFPRTDIYAIPFWARVLPFPSYRQSLEKKRFAQRDALLGSFEIAFRDLKEETALLAIHLGKSRSDQTLTVVDAAGCTHHLPLSTTSFILQYRHPILMEVFSAAIQRGEREEAEAILDAFLFLIHERAKKGILDRDRRFLGNYAFDGKRAYQIDVGNFFYDPNLEASEAFQKSVSDSVTPLREWLASHSPEMLHRFIMFAGKEDLLKRRDQIPPKQIKMMPIQEKRSGFVP